MFCSYFLLAVLTGCVDSVTGYSNGKVSVACEDMVPQHGYKSRPDPPPYSLTVDKSTFSPGDRITMSLQVASSNATFFKGFLIEAWDAKKLNSPAVGLFILTDPYESQLLECSHTQGSAVSHRRSSKKTHIQAVWESPKNPPPTVQFLMTVVQRYKVYWVRIAGPVVSLTGVTGAPSTAVPSQTTSNPALPAPFSAVGCGHSKSCLRDPVGCLPESDPHCFFLSFITDESGQGVMFELSGPDEGYISFALSLDKWMGNDDVYLCVNDGSRVTISAAYVSARTHPELATEEALWGQAWRLADGVIQCRFHRNNFLPNRFNLNQGYFVFVAHGQSDQGVLMLTGWMWTASTGIIIARHYKHLWPDRTLLGQRLWFQLHRTMMVLAVVLTGVAFTLPFIYRRGWSKHAGSHPYIGCTVTALSVVQPLIAFLRPTPESPRRILFNWMHFVAAMAGQILAVLCVFLGPAQEALLLPSPWFPAVLTAWLLWILLADLLLLIQSCRLKSKGNSNSDDKENIFFGQLERQQHGEISTVKKTVLLVFLLGNTGFLAAFLKAITSV